MVISKSIVADLNNVEKFIGDNYDIWHHKIQLPFEEFEILNYIVNPPNANSPKREIKLYEKLEKKHSLSQIMIMSVMHNDLLCE